MPTKKILTIAECEKAIQVIEMSPSNVVGGRKAFSSGRQIVLTPCAQNKVAALERRINELSEGDEDE